MGLDHRMRCLMLVSNPRIKSLATSRVLGYALAHGQDCVKSVDRAAACVGAFLRADGEAGIAQAGDWWRTIYVTGAGSQTGRHCGLV